MSVAVGEPRVSVGDVRAGAPRAVGLRRWARFIARRAASLLVIAFILIVATFFLVRLIPGDPAARLLGDTATPDAYEMVRERLGLDEPVLSQLANYVGGVVRFDLGTSLVSDFSVAQLIGERLGRSMLLAGAGTALVLLTAMVGGVTVGVMTVTGRRRGLDNSFTVSTGLLGSVPEYVLATVLVLVFGIWLGWLPVAGADAGLRSLILPAVAVAVRPAATLARIVRLETFEAFSQDFVRTGRSKRLPTIVLVARHVVPNVLTSALTMGGVILGSLLGGAVVVETVFAWPGLGTALITAVRASDYPTIQGIVLVLGIAVVLLNTIIDLVLAALDPRRLQDGV